MTRLLELLGRACRRPAVGIIGAAITAWACVSDEAAAQQLVFQPVGAPSVVGNGVGKRALWANAGTVDGQVVDIVGVLTDAALDHSFGTGNAQIQVTSAAQDAHFADFYIYAAGTHDIGTDTGGVPVIADVFVQINDIDGPSNEQVYTQLCAGQVEFIRIDKDATTNRSFFTGASPFGTEIFILSGDQNYANQPESGLEIFYPQTSVFRFGRTANPRFLVRLGNPTYEKADTLDMSCADFRATNLVDDVKEQELGQPVTLNILFNDSIATENNNAPANDSGAPSRYALQAIDLVPPAGAINPVTDSSGHIVAFDMPGEGTWTYDDLTGELTFTPLIAFFGVPTPIDYRYQRPENTAGQVYSAPANVSIDVGAVGLLKFAALADTNLNGYADPGETIAYAFTAENFGNVTLTNVALAETQFSGQGVPPVITFQSATALSPDGTLEPGEKAIYTATYTLVPADLDTTITNQAVVTATTPAGTPVSDLSDSENETDGDGVAQNGPGAGRDDPTSIYAGSGPDRGDAPVTYGDPEHADTSGYRIGAVPGDGDSGAQHSADASGDDADLGGDDEAEEAFPQLYGGLTRSVAIPVGEASPGAGRLQVFVDFAADGSFLTPGDQVGTDLSDGGPGDLDGVVDGVITFEIAVPPTAPLVPTFARLRFSTVSGLDSVTAAPDGEVEDYAIVLQTPPDADRGDAPASYGDPQHVVEGAATIYLGATPPDVDLLAQSSVAADGDDLDGSDDEDGVVLPTLYAGGLSEITVQVVEPAAGTAWLQAFIDFDGDGDFAQAGDRVATDIQDGGAGDKDGAANGAITFEVAVPAGASTLPTYARFRWSTDTLNATTAFDGEVEDYPLTISSDPPPFLCDNSLYRLDGNSATLRRLQVTTAGSSYTVGTSDVGNGGSDLAGGWGYNAVDGYLYGVRPNGRRLYRVDGSGNFTNLGNISGADDARNAGDILPDGTMLYVVDNVTWQIVDLSNPAAAIGVGVLNLSFGIAPEDIAYNPVDGNIYGIDQISGRVFRVSPNGGVPGAVSPTLFGPAIYAGNFGSVWFDQDGRMYGYSDTTDNLYLIDTVTGFAQLIATVAADDFGSTEAASCRGPAPVEFGAIAGNVYEDNDASDTRDAGEPNLGAGVGIQIFHDNNTPANFSDDVEVGAADTAADGSYGFESLLINSGYRILLDEADPDLGVGRTIGTSNPLLGVAVAANTTTEAQDFGFDASGADLSLTKYAALSGTTTPRSSASAGDLIDWIITIDNSGSGSPSGVKVIDRIPAGYDYVSDDAPATGDTYDPDTGLWFVDEILAGTSETLVVTVRMRDSGATTNLAEIVYSSLPDPDSDVTTGHLVDDGNDGVADDDEASYALARLIGGRRLAGQVFIDNGAGGATAHDALRTGAEAGAEGSRVRLLDASGALLDEPVVAADGTWSYTLPASYTQEITIEIISDSNQVPISERTDGLPGLVDTDPHDGRYSFTPDSGADYLDLDLGVLPVPQLSHSQAAAISAGQVVSLSHRYTASSSGDVTFSVTTLAETPAGGYAVSLYRDIDCDGEADTPLVAGVAVTAQEVVCVVARIAAGGGVGPSGSFAFRLEAATTFSNTTASNQLVNVDRLGAATASGLILRKTVQNLTQNTAENTANSGVPGDVLAYRIHVVNAASEPVGNIEIFDRTPPYTELDSSPLSPTALSSAVSCAMVEPAAPAAGYSGHLRWTCSGALDPGAEGSVVFEVRIAQ
ncbi:MAG: GEVED domain-containing protein [Marinobacter sp.]